MLFFKKRYELLQLAKEHRLPKIYDLLEILKNDTSISVAATDGTDIYINLDSFNNYSAPSQFFILCHELLHIVYHHLDKTYYPEEIYTNKELLNMCQDVIINEFLAKRLKYTEPTGLYLNNIVNALYARGYIKSSNISYTGVLTTKQLYNFFNRQCTEDELQQILQDLNYNSSEDRKERDEEDNQSVQEKQRMNDAIENAIKGLNITDKILDNEHADRQIDAGTSDDYDGTVSSNAEVKTISSDEMVKYINQFIGTNAVIKGRHRTYTRPSRRIHLKNDMLSPGYKHFKNIKKISMYLDVSGSMDSYLVTSLYKTLKLLYNKVEFDFYTFTTRIEKIDIKNTQNIYIGGGTDITRVLNYIDDEKQDVAIMITDCDDRFTLKDVKSNLMIYTNNKSVNNNNPRVQLTYFN